MHLDSFVFSESGDATAGLTCEKTHHNTAPAHHVTERRPTMNPGTRIMLRSVLISTDVSKRGGPRGPPLCSRVTRVSAHPFTGCNTCRIRPGVWSSGSG